MTADIRRKSRRKHWLYKKYKRTGSAADREAFQSPKRETSKWLKRARVKHINTRIVGGLMDNDTNPFWRYLKTLKQDCIGLPPLRQGGALYTAAKDKARILLNEFGSVFTIEDIFCIPWLGRSRHCIDPIVVQVAGVRKLLQRLKPEKASGRDRIPNRVLKELADELAPPLSALFNQSLESGCIPDDWSKVFVSPVFKKGNVHKASNYRPVSLTCVACKLLEHVICSHVLTYLDKHHPLSNYQHGFRKGHSCGSQILITLDDLYRSFDKRNRVDMGVLDFSRAFVTVPHMSLPRLPMGNPPFQQKDNRPHTPKRGPPHRGSHRKAVSEKPWNGTKGNLLQQQGNSPSM